MPERIWTLAKAFAHFGATATNGRWAWSARNADGTTIVLTLWDDEIDDDGATVTADFFNRWNLPVWRDRLGNRDRIKNLRLARDCAGGLFRVVMVTAKDPQALTRSIIRRYPHPTLVMKLLDGSDGLNEVTGEFRAVSVSR
ncbi:MAG TPA: hypothetical protein VGI95_09365 [Caulobacteraceae bacterium]